MKKRNLKKEELTYDKENMLKKIDRYYNFTEIIETILKIGSILVIIGMLIIVISFLQTGTENTQEISSDTEDTSLISMEDILDLDEDSKLSKDLNEMKNENPEKYNIIIKILTIAFSLVIIIRLIIIIYVLDLLKKLFKSTLNNQTPFTEDNVRNMKKMVEAVIALCIFVLSEISIHTILFIVVIIALNQVFRYGYELQKESDELL
jgi:hypothetical protein